MTVGEGFSKYKFWIIGGVIVLLLLILFLVNNSVTNNGNKKQQDLITYYNDTSNVLSDCLVKTKQAIGSTGAQEDALDRVITDAVRGRYTEGSTAQPGSNNALFSAISEAYPDTAGLSKAFDDVRVIITGCRTDFRDSQAILQRNVSEFVKWQEGSMTVRTFGGEYPTDSLEIAYKGDVITGDAALRQMRTLVLVSEAREGRDSGEIENDDPFSEQ